MNYANVSPTFKFNGRGISTGGLGISTGNIGTSLELSTLNIKGALDRCENGWSTFQFLKNFWLPPICMYCISPCYSCDLLFML